jgi:hypothetical protein
LPKSLRLKAWLTLCEYAYPRLATIVPNESVSTRLEELQYPWDAITLAELKETFRKELDTLPDDVRRELEKLIAENGFDPLVMQTLLKFKFVEKRTESQAQAQAPEEEGLKVVKKRPAGCSFRTAV